MTKSEMFREAHKQARADHKRFGGSYRQCFAYALCGFQAVARGFIGITIIEPKRVWA